MANDLHISGSGEIPSGEYEKIGISGSGRASGDVSCANFRVSGSGKIAGALTVRGEAAVSGSLRVDKELRAEALKVSGSAVIDGPLFGGEISVSGSAKIGGDAQADGVRASGSLELGGNLRAQKISLSGRFRAQGDVSCEEFSCSGLFQIGGLLNAERVTVDLVGHCAASEIGGETIEVRLEKVNSVLSFLGVRGGSLSADDIEGTNVTLINTTAKVVRGQCVHIGPNCEIGRVEYGQTLTVDPSANVGERQQA